MSSIDSFSKSAFEFSLSVELQRRMQAIGASIICEKSRAYYRTLLAYTRIPPWKEAEYEQAASVVTDSLLSLSNNVTNQWMPKFIFKYPFVQSANYDGDLRDIIVETESGATGIVIEEYPKARLQSPLLFKSNNNVYKTLDIGSEWFENGSSTSEFTTTLEKIGVDLDASSGKQWNDAFANNEEKYKKLYVPLLTALKNEIDYQCNVNDSHRNFIKYLFGPNDYYLVDLDPRVKKAKVAAYEINGNLGSDRHYCDSLLPTSLICTDFKKRANSVANSIISLTFDNGWIVNLRLKQTGLTVRPDRLRLEADFNGTKPFNLIQNEVKWG